MVAYAFEAGQAFSPPIIEGTESVGCAVLERKSPDTIKYVLEFKFESGFKSDSIRGLLNDCTITSSSYVDPSEITSHMKDFRAS